MKYYEFPDDKSDRSELFYDLYKEIQLKDRLSKEDTNSHINLLKQRGSLLHDTESKHENVFIDYKIYLKNKYSYLTHEEKVKLCENSTEKIQVFLFFLFSLIFIEELNYDEEKETLELNLEDYFQSNDIQDFHYSLRSEEMYFVIKNYRLRAEIFEQIKYKQSNLKRLGKDYFLKITQFLVLQHDVIFKEILFDQDYSIYNHLLKTIKTVNNELYNLLNNAIINNVISLEGDKINFPYSRNTITTIFKNNNYTKWSYISKHILSMGEYPTNLGKTEPDISTKNYKEFIQQLNKKNH